MALKPGLVSGCYLVIDSLAKYLPQVETQIHTTVLDSISRTNLTQTFINPSKEQVARELRYVFPLDNGASVVGFTCFIGDRVIRGVVKESREAQADFVKAKAQGSTAGLVQQSQHASDIFSTTLGNLPPGETLRVEVAYLGELKHDAGVDGLRLTIPTQLAPRYGSAAWETNSSGVQQRGMSITIDVEMPEGSVIKNIQSSSHPMSVTIGTLSTAPSSEPNLRKASATFSQSSVSLDKDVVIDVVATNFGEPAAFLETHPTFPNQQALMATFVPKFTLTPMKPEIVFLCDRSGSMAGQLQDLVSALHILLRSLPVGVKFNICSFGSRHSFLWERSKSYDQESFEQAKHHIDSFGPDYGGTEISEPAEATFKRRYKDMNLEVFVLTDGRVDDQDKLFTLIHTWIAKSNQSIRVFSLGIGRSVSSSLVEGIARAGNGFSQTVQASEKMDKKVVRLLKGALLPHIKDYSLEIKYGRVDSQGDDGFEIIEKISDSLLVHSKDDEDWTEVENPDAPTTDTPSVEREGNLEPDADNSDELKHRRLPTIPPPDYIQVPSQITQVFPFHRTTAYVLLSNQNPDREPKSVLLKGSSDQGPLELEIPIVRLAEKSTTIHQMAARKEIKDLEENRGWLSVAKDPNGEFLKDRFRPGFFNMAKREAVRLGVLFQVMGKWCSFIAVQEPATRGLGGLQKEIGEIDISSLPLTSGSSKPSIAIRASGNFQARSLMTTSHPARSIALSAGEQSSGRDDNQSSSFTMRPLRRTIARQRLVSGSTKTDTTHTNRPELQKLISLQGFEGSWAWSTDLEAITKVPLDSLRKINLPPSVSPRENTDSILATLCAIAFLDKNFMAEKETWALIVDKAVDWLGDQVGSSVEGLIVKVSDLT